MRSASAVVLLCLAPLGLGPSAWAASVDTLAAGSAARDTSRKESRFYFGGGIGLSFSTSVTQLWVQPFVGYKLTKKTSLGGRLTYRYYRDRRYRPTVTALDYGGSLFARHRVFTQGFVQAEFEVLNLEFEEEREFVPFLLVGGGYAQPLAPRTSLLVEVMVDLLRDERGRRVRDQDPRVSVGIGVGF